MKIEILGTGCAKCKKLQQLVEKVVTDAGASAEVTKVEKIEDQIAHRDLAAPRRPTTNGKQRVELRLHGSALLVLHGGDLLMLSPKDRPLVRFDQDGDVAATTALDSAVLPPPEPLALTLEEGGPALRCFWIETVCSTSPPPRGSGSPIPTRCAC